MSRKSDTNVKAGVAAFLQPGEEVVTSLIASVRGHQQAMSGGLAGAVGGRRAGKAREAAAARGITLAAYMALVLTPARVILVEVGNAGRVKGLLGEFDLAEVGPMAVQRRGLGGAVTLAVRGAEVRLESRVGAARAFAAALDRARADR